MTAVPTLKRDGRAIYPAGRLDPHHQGAGQDCGHDMDMDMTKLTPEKIELASPTRENGKTQIKILQVTRWTS